VDWIPDAIAAFGAVFELIGLTGLILILATALIAFSVWMNGGRATEKRVAEVVAPVTCQWADNERSRLNRLAEQVERMADNMERSAESAQRMERDIIRISAIVSRSDGMPTPYRNPPPEPKG